VAEPALCGGFWTRTELGFGTGPGIMVSRPFEILDTRRKLDLVFVALQLTLRSNPTRVQPYNLQMGNGDGYV
jgi:hypothetical protein